MERRKGGGGGRREEKRSAANVGEHKQLIKQSDSAPRKDNLRRVESITARTGDRQTVRTVWEGQRRRHVIGQITGEGRVDGRGLVSLARRHMQMQMDDNNNKKKSSGMFLQVGQSGSVEGVS